MKPGKMDRPYLGLASCYLPASEKESPMHGATAFGVRELLGVGRAEAVS